MSFFSQNQTWRLAAAAHLVRLCAGAALGWGARAAWTGLEAPDGGSPGPGGEVAAVGTWRGDGGRDAGELFPPGSTPFQQMTRALTAGDGLSAGEIRGLLEQTARFPANGAGEIGKAALYRRWLALDPEGALRHCREHDGDMLPRLSGNYAVKNPDRAVELILELPAEDAGKILNSWEPKPHARKRAWAELARTALLKGPDTALETIRKAWNAEPWGSDTKSGLEPVLCELARAMDPEAFAARSGELPAPLRKTARRVLCDRMVERDGIAGWKWMTEQEDSKQLRETAWEALLRKDLSAAFALLDGLDPELRRELTGRTTGEPDIAEKAEALRGVTQLSATTREELARRVLHSCGPEDLESVSALLPLTGESLEPGDFTLLLRPWAKNDPARGQEWVESLPGGRLRDAAAKCWDDEMEDEGGKRVRNGQSDTRNDAMLAAWDGGARILDHWQKLARLDPAGLDEALAKGNQRVELAEHLAEENPAAGVAWLASHEPDEATITHTARFAATWGRNDPAAAAAWAGSLPEGSAGMNAVYNVAREYARYAPGRAEAWAAVLASGAMRDAAAKGLAER